MYRGAFGGLLWLQWTAVVLKLFKVDPDKPPSLRTGSGSKVSGCLSNTNEAPVLSLEPKTSQ